MRSIVVMLLASLSLSGCQSTKLESAPMVPGWKDTTVLQMHQNCLNTAAQVKMPQPASDSFCNCMIGTLVSNGTEQDWNALDMDSKRTVSQVIGQMCLEAVFGEEDKTI